MSPSSEITQIHIICIIIHLSLYQFYRYIFRLKYPAGKIKTNKSIKTERFYFTTNYRIISNIWKAIYKMTQKEEEFGLD